MDEEREPPPEPSHHLRPLHGEAKWVRALGPVGLALGLAALALTFVAPSALWFLLYPLLIVGALAALASAAAFLLRHF